MEFIKIYEGDRPLRFSKVPGREIPASLGNMPVLKHQEANAKILLSETNTKQLSLARIIFKTPASKVFTLSTPDYTVTTAISLNGAATLMFKENPPLLLAKDTSLLYFSRSSTLQLKPRTKELSLLLIGCTAERSNFPGNLQLMEDFFIKLRSQEFAFLFPGVYPMSAVSIKNLTSLQQGNVAAPQLEATYRLIMAREIENRTTAYQVFRKVETTATRDEAIFEVIERILLHLEDSYSIESLAASIFTNPASLNKRFKQATGQSIFSFLRQTKIDRGIHLLQNSDHSMEEITAMLGFCSKVQFARFLKRQTGKTTADFRNTRKD